MTETQNRVTACLNSALQSFNQNEQYLISRDLSERCICAKFASYDFIPERSNGTALFVQPQKIQF